MKNIYDYTLEELQAYFVEKNEKPFRATQVFEWLYKKRISNFDEMSNIKKEMIDYSVRNIQDKKILSLVKRNKIKIRGK